MKKLDLYWKSNREWYDYDYSDNELGTPYLTEKATDEAKESFEHYLEQKKDTKAI